MKFSCDFLLRLESQKHSNMKQIVVTDHDSIDSLLTYMQMKKKKRKEATHLCDLALLNVAIPGKVERR